LKCWKQSFPCKESHFRLSAKRRFPVDHPDTAIRIPFEYPHIFFIQSERTSAYWSKCQGSDA
jgi:hypothetical protein